MGQQSMRIQQYVRAFIEGWWIIVATLCIGVGIAVLYSYSQPSVYQATATFVTSSRLRTTDPGDLVDSLDTLAARTGVVSTYCAILESKSIVQEATLSLGLPVEATAPYDVNCVVLPDSSVLRLEIRGASPYLAADLANAIGAVGVQYVRDLQEVYELRRLDLAVTNTGPISPNHFVDVAMGAIVSLMGGIALVLLRQGLTTLLGESSPPPADAQQTVGG
jgi:uncharacterized protein involved in exopolysaccharide biosynthesis